MEEKNVKDQPQSRVRKGSSTFIYIAIVVVTSVLFFNLYLGKINTDSPQTIEENITKETQSETTEQPDSPAPEFVDQQKISSDAEASPDPSLPTAETGAGPAGQGTSGGTLNLNLQQQLSATEQQQLVEEINTFYEHLDEQPYIQNLGLEEPSKIYFSKLLQKVVHNPPVIFGESDDLFTILQNTAHFFRVLGKENINIFKEILSKEKKPFEQVVKSFYQLTNQPETLKKEYSLSLPPDAFTNYAAFFLNTMGGRLYLFRRDSTSRMLVSYYAIITIDQANIEGRGGHGIDLRPSIDSLIDEMENGGSRLQLRDEYLDNLYDLQEKYN